MLAHAYDLRVSSGRARCRAPGQLALGPERALQVAWTRGPRLLARRPLDRVV